MDVEIRRGRKYAYLLARCSLNSKYLLVYSDWHFRYFCHMGASEIILILVVYLLLFGAKGVPALAQTLGKAVYQFRNATQEVQKEIMKGADDIRKQAAIKPDQFDVEPAPRKEEEKSPS
jgi:sec-independent protein translocase protein TatA